jgi:hypothetical protein
MDIPHTFTAWAAVGLALLAPVGAVFGGIAGAVARLHGHAPGCALGRAIAHKLARLSEKEFSPTVEGFIIGSVDGALFLGMVGILVGLIAGYAGDSPNATLLLVAAAGVAVLALAALILGSIALGLARSGTVGLVFFCFATVGGLLGLGLGGTREAMGGLAAGAVLGVLAGLLQRRS